MLRYSALYGDAVVTQKQADELSQLRQGKMNGRLSRAVLVFEHAYKTHACKNHVDRNEDGIVAIRKP